MNIKEYLKWASKGKKENETEKALDEIIEKLNEIHELSQKNIQTLDSIIKITNN